MLSRPSRVGDFGGTGNDRNPIFPCRLALFLLIAVVLISPSAAREPERIWVDASGLHAIRARLTAVQEDHVVLLRNDGGESRIEISQLSARDQEYLEELDEQQLSENDLRRQPPLPREIVPLPVLELPPASAVARQGSALIPASSAIMMADNEAHAVEPPAAIAADRAPVSIQVPAARISVGKVGGYEICSQIFPLRQPHGSSLAMSISNGFSIPGEGASSRLIRFDLDTQQMQVVWQSDETITLLDHHDSSELSLVLLGHNPLGQGGQLAMAGHWDTDTVVVRHRRSLPESGELTRAPHVRWAKWIDQQHVIAAIDGTLAAWNMVSGQPLYRIEGVHPKAMPALSGGHRYVAVPSPGAVDLYGTESGTRLGRIGIDVNSLPSVSFSPPGDALAIASSRRLRVWDLTTGSWLGDIKTRRSLGKGSPIWVDPDLVMSSSGTLISVFRGLPVWDYDLTSTTARSLGDHVAVFRRRPTGELNVISLPHERAQAVLQEIDVTRIRAEPDRWTVPGRSVWHDGAWDDRDVRVGRSESKRR